MDYIIGRMNGVFLQDEPSRYHRRRRNLPWQKSSDTSKTVEDSTSGQAFSTLPCNHENSVDTIEPHTNYERTTVQNGAIYHKLTSKSLLEQNCPAQAESLFGVVSFLTNLGDHENFLDQQISNLRQVQLNKTRNGSDQNRPLIGQESNKGKVLTHSIDFGPLSINKDREAEKLLQEISSILSGLYIPQRVVQIMSTLRDQYLRTRDIVTLRMARDKHRDIALRANLM